jgi:hypothetical protein
MKKIIFGILFLLAATPVSAQSAAFRFGVWADTKSGTGILNTDSLSMAAKNPLFLFYPGDVCSSGPTAACLATWKTAYNAGGDLLSKSFVSRGNHDSAGTSVWIANFIVNTTAGRIGATNLNQLSTNLTYSFDYGNAHFAAVDMPGGDATTISSAQLNWLDADLTAAENRGVTHSFLFWHGPEYPMGGHCCTNAPAITNILNKHPSVSATFHGHEHNLAYTHIDSSKIAGVTHPYEEFTSGGAGADLYGCQRGDWCKSMDGFMTVDVNGSVFTVTAFNSAGATQNNWIFNKSGNPTPTVKPTATPVPNTPTPTIRPTTTPVPPTPTVRPSSTPVPTATVSPTAGPTIIPTPTIPGNDIQPGFPVRAAFYYPWFPDAWTQLGHYPYTNYHPSLGFYNSADVTTIASHVQAMMYGKIQVGISSWWGQGDHSDTNVAYLLRGADNTGFRWTIYYEPEGSGNPTVAQLQSDLNYIRSHYGSDKNYYRINGRPVIFVYGDGSDGCSMADRWKQANTTNFYTVLKVFPGYAACTSQPDNWHQYSPAVAEDAQSGHSFTISPGFNKYGEAAARLARDPNRWLTNIAHMTASKAPFQLITTFNEWGEGSSVESASEWASGSRYGTYLDALHNDGAVPSPTIVPPTPTPVPLNGDANGDGKVDNADYQIWLTNYGHATGGQVVGDFDHNGQVDGLDFVIWLNTYTG